MSTKVFISWSGELSKQVAALLKKWLPSVIQDIDPFFSRTDISKGGKGLDLVLENMRDSKIAISCLTKCNKEKPWIEFEAGFLDGLKVPVCGFLINISDQEINYPMKQFQLTVPEKDDMFNLLKTLNSCCINPISEDRLRSEFNDKWRKFLNAFNKIHSSTNEPISNEDQIENLIQKINDLQEKLNISQAVNDSLREELNKPRPAVFS